MHKSLYMYRLTFATSYHLARFIVNHTVENVPTAVIMTSVYSKKGVIEGDACSSLKYY